MRRASRLLILLGVALVLILGVLFLLGSSSYNRKQNETKVILLAIAQASRDYKNDTGHWPQSLDDLETPKKAYLLWGRSKGQDAWGRGVQYRAFDSSRGFGRVWSYGQDGKPGGQDMDQDLEVRFNEGFPRDVDVQTLTSFKQILTP